MVLVNGCVCLSNIRRFSLNGEGVNADSCWFWNSGYQRKGGNGNWKHTALLKMDMARAVLLISVGSRVVGVSSM